MPRQRSTPPAQIPVRGPARAGSGERALLRKVRRMAAAGPRTPTLRLGIGDDAALLRIGAGNEAVLTTDLFVEGVHFLRERDSALTCGRRLATRALSDLAAMGAEPLAVFLSCGFPEDVDDAWRKGLIRGVVSAAREAGAALAGGDLARSPHGVFADIVGLGRVPPRHALLRRGAQPGDLIFVSGTPGLAAWGRRLAHSGALPTNAAARAALRRHQRPRARWELGIALRGLASAAIDISDGLSTDLDHICEESRVGAVVDAAVIPHPAVSAGLELALGGGEDYELLFTVAPSRSSKVKTLAKELRLPLTRIGEITRRRGLRVKTAAGRIEPLAITGWEHFAR